MEVIEENDQINDKNGISNETEETKRETPNNEDELKVDSYLNRNEYSSERYKIELKNLPKNFGFAQLRKLLRSLNLKFVKINSPGRCTYAFITFVDENAKQEAMKILNGYKYRGHELAAIHAKPVSDPSAALANNLAIRKRKNKEDGNDSENKQAKIDDGLSLDEKVQNSTTPLWNLPYEEQVIKKRDEVKNILKKFSKSIEKTNNELEDWFKKQKNENDSMCCKLEDYIPSPVSDNYRNKCEFSIGYNADETKQVVGFRLGEYKSGSNEVVSPQVCKNIADEVKSIVQIFNDYINEKSKYKAFSVRTHEGHWRQLTVRNNLNKDILAIVVFDKKNLTDIEINEEKQLLVSYIKTVCLETNIKIVSLLFFLNTKSNGIANMNNNLEKLIGSDECLYEQLFDLKFRISPLAFFQANTKGAEVLYSKIGEFADIDANTVVLDVCCGTGTIGLTLAKKAKRVVGVEMIQQAIDDAKLNSQLNNISNVEFLCGKAEDVLPPLLKRFETEKIIAIVDPPRAGLHSKVIQALRRLKNLDTIIYVSCNAELAMHNFVDFGRSESNNYRYEPFVPIKALGVDMFPHTSHYELVVLLKRYKKEFLNDNTKNNNNNLE